MRWPWRRDKSDEFELMKARQRLADSKRQWPKVREAAETMERHREVNGFAEMIQKAMGVER